MIERSQIAHQRNSELIVSLFNSGRTGKLAISGGANNPIANLTEGRKQSRPQAVAQVNAANITTLVCKAPCKKIGPETVSFNCKIRSSELQRGANFSSKI
jgi:hypothetical protein